VHREPGYTQVADVQPDLDGAALTTLLGIE
jgi:hypothetical protein